MAQYDRANTKLKRELAHIPPSKSNSIDDLKEKLAAIEHERWSDWQKWCHKVLGENMPSDVFQDYVWPILVRWEKQADTPYEKLSDSEKASDMEQVDRYWPLIEAYISERVKETEAGWQIQLPDLPWFQIKAFNEERAEWTSPIYDTKNLPAKLQSYDRKPDSCVS